MTPATAQKHKQLQHFIDYHLKPETAMKGVVGIGSIASGYSRPNSDIDAILFLDPLAYTSRLPEQLGTQIMTLFIASLQKQWRIAYNLTSNESIGTISQEKPG